MLSLPSDVKELVPEFYSNDPSFLVGGLRLCCDLWTAKRSTARPPHPVAGLCNSVPATLTAAEF